MRIHLIDDPEGGGDLDLEFDIELAVQAESRRVDLNSTWTRACYSHTDPAPAVVEV